MTGTRLLTLLAAVGYLVGGGMGTAKADDPAPVPIAVFSRPEPVAGPTEVRVRMWIANIDAIDSVTQSFTANFFILLRWRDPRLAHEAEAGYTRFDMEQVWNPRLTLLNPVGAVRRALPEAVDVAPDGTVIYRQAFITTLSQRLDLADFPFDEQVFSVRLISAAGTPDEVRLVPDPDWTGPRLRQAAGIAEEISLPDWVITDWSAGPAPYVVVPGTEIPGFAMEFRARRVREYYGRKVILPLIMIVMMSWAVFWIDPTNRAPQISIAITSMLTLIAYRFAVGHDLPPVPYTTRMDRFILASTVLVFLSLVQVIITSSFARSNREAFARGIDRVSRVIFPVAFAMIVLKTLFI